MSKLITFIRPHILLILSAILAAFSLTETGKTTAAFTALSADYSVFSYILVYAISVFFVLLIAKFIGLIFKLKWFFNLPLTLVLLAGTAAGLNLILDQKTQTLQANDQLNFNQETAIKILAMIDNRGTSADSICDDFCQRALYKQQYDKIIIGNWLAINSASEIAGQATAFWQEFRDQCPATDSAAAVNPLKLSGVDADYGEESAQFLLTLDAARGQCLVSAPANLADAEAALVYGVLQRGLNEYTAGLDLFADTSNANQLAYWVKNQGEMQLKYQQTATNNLKFTRLLLPYLAIDNFEAKAVWMREKNLSQNDLNLPLEPFLQNILKLDLLLDEPEVGEQIGDIMMRVMGGTAPIAPARLQVIDELFQSIGLDGEFSDTKAVFYLDLLADERIPFTFASAGMFANDIHGNKAHLPAYAKAIFARLENYKLRQDEDEQAELENISIAIHYLPTEAIMPYFTTLKALANDQQKNIYIGATLARLGEFGHKSTDILLQLIDNASQNDMATIGLHSTYWAGMSGLCILAENDAKQGIKNDKLVQEIFQRLDQGKIILVGTHWSKLIHLLSILGASPPDIWSHLPTEGGHLLQKFDKQVKSVNQKADCNWYK